MIGDGKAQCSDASDETNSWISWIYLKCEQVSDAGCQILRAATTWKLNKRNLVVPFHWLCNTLWDIPGGLDEIQCAINGWVCPPNWIQYNRSNIPRWNGNCAPSNIHCDREWDLPDGSDEWDCPALTIDKL